MGETLLQKNYFPEVWEFLNIALNSQNGNRSSSVCVCVCDENGLKESVIKKTKW